MTPEDFEEINRILNLVPCTPWSYSEGDDFDHWELWSCKECVHMVFDDSGVPPDKGFIEYVLKSREIIEMLLNEIKELKNGK